MAKQIKKEIKNGIAKKKGIKYLFIVTIVTIISCLTAKKVLKTK